MWTLIDKMRSKWDSRIPPWPGVSLALPSSFSAHHVAEDTGGLEGVGIDVPELALHPFRERGFLILAEPVEGDEVLRTLDTFAGADGEIRAVFRAEFFEGLRQQAGEVDRLISHSLKAG